MASTEGHGGSPCGFARQNSGNSLSLDFEPEAEYRFVETLEERYKCARCRAVLHNPHQTGCGHRFCQRCILALRELNTGALCPVDKEVIRSQEVFRDNWCRREVLNLYVYCKNAPGCQAKIILGRYQAKRASLPKHEHSALQDHMRLVLEQNQRLEEQISGLYKSLEQKESKIQQLEETVQKFAKEFTQFTELFGRNGTFLSNMQVLTNHMDRFLWLEAQVRQLLQTVSQQPAKLDLRPLAEEVDTLKLKVALLETNDHRLGVLEGETHRHDIHISIHQAQLSSNEERFRELAGACYRGKLIWKVTDYRAKKREAVDGHTVSIFSQPFYTSRCGYRLCARAYLNGDGTGKGTHLSLYFVVMRGEFDALLPWPFRQRVTLMLLDQSGKRNHVTETFKADPNSSSFKRPDGEMNIASGCPRFVAHETLESAKGLYIKEDTLFLKVAVDLSDLDDL
ncbi:PREDICTED: TNF receptor-associated factor 5 [Condylura cristata]|uniref:TNF receptor-associated factor 5 n=1 Tax=Condylura cristata TaxID=143302 RepID=UPI0003345151|nr:PREDICTED: TNF receptor-associated factor 5 [Condylura cristata]